ncbi:MAG: hypothetical protein ABI114_10810 [Rhodanobacter sp.]
MNNKVDNNQDNDICEFQFQDVDKIERESGTSLFDKRKFADASNKTKNLILNPMVPSFPDEIASYMKDEALINRFIILLEND